MPAYKVLQSHSINGREPQPVGTVIILSESEAATFLANNAIEIAEVKEPDSTTPSIAQVEPITSAQVESPITTAEVQL